VRVEAWVAGIGFQQAQSFSHRLDPLGVTGIGFQRIKVRCRPLGEYQSETHGSVDFFVGISGEAATRAHLALGGLVQSLAHGGQGGLILEEPLHGKLPDSAFHLDCMRCHGHGAGVKQVTVRRVGDKCIELAKHKAKERRVSMNTVLVEALEVGLGVDSEVIHHDLDHYIGASDFGPDWDRFLKEDLNKIDPESWQ
jgi:hypothetical protein